MHRLAKLARENAFATAVGFSGGACVGLVGWGGAQFIIPGVVYMGHSQLAAAGDIMMLGLCGCAGRGVQTRLLTCRSSTGQSP